MCDCEGNDLTGTDGGLSHVNPPPIRLKIRPVKADFCVSHPLFWTAENGALALTKLEVYLGSRFPLIMRAVVEMQH